MSIADVTNNLRRYVDELEGSVSGRCSDADFQYAMKRFIMSTYSSLASLAWYGGASELGAATIHGEAVSASGVIDEAFAAENREAEFDAPAARQPYSALNHRQQFGTAIEGARL